MPTQKEAYEETSITVIDMSTLQSRVVAKGLREGPQELPAVQESVLEQEAHARSPYGRLTVFSVDPRIDREGCLICFCECGGITSVVRRKLFRGDVKSCGCLTAESTVKRSTTHGKTYTAEYRVWAGMKRRCLNPNTKDWMDYGGRGITVCDRWLKFENFFEDMGLRPSSRHSLDRWPNNDGNYEKSNCRWATPDEQSKNTGRNILITFEGRTQCRCDWAKEKGISYQTLARRLGAYGWPLERALTEPANRKYRRRKDRKDVA